MSHVAVLRAILLYSCEIVACDVVAMEKEQAFEIVSKIIFDRACQLIVGGNPAYESEKVLFHIEMCKIGRRRVGKECRSRWSPYH